MKWLTIIFFLLALNGYGQVVQNFELTNAIDGNPVALENFSSNAAIVIIVTSMNCPYTDYYLSRVLSMAGTYKGRVPFLFINTNSEEIASPSEMSAYANRNKITIPYLADQEQKVLLNLNPRKNPEAFLLQNNSGTFKVVYKGAIDDNAQSEKDVHHTYLKDAIDALLNSRKIESMDVRPVGCNIKKN